MLLTKEQVETLYNNFKVNPYLTYAHIFDVPNGSGIGPDTKAVFMSGDLLSRSVEYEVDITDVGTWKKHE